MRYLLPNRQDITMDSGAEILYCFCQKLRKQPYLREYPTNAAGNLTFGNSVSNAPSRIGKEQ